MEDHGNSGVFILILVICPGCWPHTGLQAEMPPAVSALLLHYPKSLSCAQQRAFHVRSKEHLTNQEQAISLPLHTTELPV